MNRSSSRIRIETVKTFSFALVVLTSWLIVRNFLFPAPRSDTAAAVDSGDVGTDPVLIYPPLAENGDKAQYKLARLGETTWDDFYYDDSDTIGTQHDGHCRIVTFRDRWAGIDGTCRALFWDDVLAELLFTFDRDHSLTLRSTLAIAWGDGNTRGLCTAWRYPERHTAFIKDAGDETFVLLVDHSRFALATATESGESFMYYHLSGGLPGN